MTSVQRHEKGDSLLLRMLVIMGKYISGMQCRLFKSAEIFAPPILTYHSYRPTTKAPPKPPSAYTLPTPSVGHRSNTDTEDPNDKKRWSDTQTSRTPTRNPRENSTNRVGQRSNSIQRRSVDSMSTIGGGNNLDQGQYKVIISQISNKRPGEQLLPNLSVPIPHYRLGTPRFSTKGTAMLHSQVYSRTSTADDGTSSVISGQEFDAMFPVPPGVETHSNNPPSHHTTPQPQPTLPTPAAVRIPITTTAPVFHRAKEPIRQAIYDAIARNPDDPAIVRYAMSTREISAASPARLIAQITSKNFLDYELLSDFFLTVRAYMSTHDLLAYLLTRFEWAINRFDDEARVIRVRAFAAIRHWILNYFPYDFVVDRDLRVKFCQHLNSLTRQVRKGAPHDPSDLKLIVDLKKCWNGRCALYWDSPYAEGENRNDIDITPGGIVGSRDSKLTHPSELWAKIAESSSQQVDQAKSVAALHNWVDSVIEAEVEGKGKADRGVSATTSRTTPMSVPISDQSIPAVSCSIPGKTVKNFAATQTPRNIGPHPVPATVPPTFRRVGPAALSASSNEKSLLAKKEHKRSGSFQDALGDRRTSLPSLQPDQHTQQVVMSFPFSGSLIRGSVLPPGSPFIENMSAHDSASHLPRQGQYVEGQVTVRPMSPGVKSLLGNFRRAIGSKQSPSAPTQTILSTAPFMVDTKLAHLPMHIAYKIEGSGDQYNQLQALKSNSRIDLLCADITDMFERAVAQEPPQMSAPPIDCMGSVLGDEQEELSPDHQQVLGGNDVAKLQRTHSEMTHGSRSIVIMDDTAMEPPVPTLPSEFAHLQSSGNSQVPYSTADYSMIPTPTANKTFDTTESSARETGTEDPTLQSALLPSPPRHVGPEIPPSQQHKPTGRSSRPPPSQLNRPSLTTGKSYASYRSSRSGPQSLRKYQSYQSGMRRSGPETYMDSTAPLDSPPGSRGEFEKPAGRMLRRRPGGDLRANENVHEMQPVLRSRSTGSISTYAESLRNSAAQLERVAARNAPSIRQSQLAKSGPSNPVSALTEKISLVSSSPSQPDLRPSFEAAVAEFARIPDDEGGDLEATLAKLEGKFRKSPVGTPEGPPQSEGAASQPSKSPKATDPAQETGPATTPKASASSNPLERPPIPALGDKQQGRRETMTRSLYAESEESYNSTPLVERSASKRARKAQGTSDQSNTTVPRPLFSPKKDKFDQPANDKPDDSSLANEDDAGSYEGGDFEAHMRRARFRRSSMPTCTTDSFLLDEDEFLSDLSSELSEDEDEPNEALDEAYAASSLQYQASMLPPNVTFAKGYLPSPPMTTENAAAISTENNRIQEQRKPPTPEPSPVSKVQETAKGRTPTQVDGAVLQPFANKVHQFPTRRHIPFIMAFDASVLAQQFTLVERDALNEINWQDLIDMRWQNSKTETLNWVEYLRFQDPTGIELVTARFNIVVKWALSEIVLTQNTEERARAVTKYIQMAQHSRAYHNYATMLQVTMALTSLDCSRLTKTWDLVPAAEKAALKEMEVLISPLRNFHNLRLEMETANLEDGCIPVVGK